MRHRPGSLAFVVIATLAFVTADYVIAQSSAPIVELHVDAVLASDTNQGMDKRLAWMGHQLQGLFGFSTYRLETHEDGQTQCGKMMTFALPGGHILHVQPQAIDGNMIAMELVLFEGARPMMTTELKLKNNGRLIVGGPRYEEGMLIISIGANTMAESSGQ
jgi:hypothetical protein